MRQFWLKTGLVCRVKEVGADLLKTVTLVTASKTSGFRYGSPYEVMMMKSYTLRLAQQSQSRRRRRMRRHTDSQLPLPQEEGHEHEQPGPTSEWPSWPISCTTRCHRSTVVG